MPVFNKPTQTKFHFIYIPVEDVSKMREFYTGLIGIEDASYTETKENGSLIYKFDGIHIVFYRAKRGLEPHRQWAWHYGWEGGESEQICWSVYVEENDYQRIVQGMKDAGVKCFTGEPDWRMDSYWGFNVMDPMGHTVELYTQPAKKPED